MKMIKGHNPSVGYKYQNNSHNKTNHRNENRNQAMRATISSGPSTIFPGPRGRKGAQDDNENSFKFMHEKFNPFGYTNPQKENKYFNRSHNASHTGKSIPPADGNKHNPQFNIPHKNKHRLQI